VGLAGLVNMAMLTIAAALFHGSSLSVDSIEEAHAGFKTLGTALAFGLALLASGLASSSVGTYAGQVVMQGFIARTIPLAVRRLVTMAPVVGAAERDFEERPFRAWPGAAGDVGFGVWRS
jgi:manganese transport protein